jgi:hypothetical protein
MSVIVDSAGPGVMYLTGPFGQGEVFIQQFLQQAQHGPSAIKAFVSSLIAQGVVKILYDIRTKHLYMYYGQDQVAVNYCPFWNNIAYPPPSITIAGVVVPVYGICGLKPNFRK